MDLNADGHQDMLTGSWPGELFLFKGTENNAFLPAEMIKNKNNKIINIGGGIQKQQGGGMLIRGHAKFDKTDEGTFVDYHGQRLESTADNPISISGTASAVFAVDWDADKDYDLLIGDIRGNVWLIPNEGTSQKYVFGKEKALKANGRKINAGRSAGPIAADWDNDGDLDLIVSTGDGRVLCYTNEGTRAEPKLTEPKELLGAVNVSYGEKAPKEVKRGGQAKVCVVDWNGDGLLDLLVGDRTYQKPNLPDPTPEQQAEYDRIRKELEPFREQFGELINKIHGPNRERDKAKLEKIYEKLNVVSDKMTELREKLPTECETHGWVWLYLRTSI